MTGGSFWRATAIGNVSTPSPLTVEDFKRLADDLFKLSRLHVHLVSGKDKARGWGYCRECFQLVGDPPPSVSREYLAAWARLFGARLERFPADAVEVE